MEVVAVRGLYKGVVGVIMARRGEKALVSAGRMPGVWIAMKELRAVR